MQIYVCSINTCDKGERAVSAFSADTIIGTRRLSICRRDKCHKKGGRTIFVL